MKKILLLTSISVVWIFSCSMKNKKKVIFVDEKTPEIENVSFTVNNTKYTPYQVVVWHLKTSEGFRSKPYPDGKYPSIGFGCNMIPSRKIAPYQTWESATTLLANEVKKIQKNLYKRFPDFDDWQIAALTCRFYNRGEGSLPSFKEEYLLGCCGSKYSCGYTDKNIKKQKSVRDSHNNRRRFEYNLFTKKFDKLQIEKIKEKCQRLKSNI